MCDSWASSTNEPPRFCAAVNLSLLTFLNRDSLRLFAGTTWTKFDSHSHVMVIQLLLDSLETTDPVMWESNS